MTEGPEHGDRQESDEKPEHTPAEEQAFKENIKVIADLGKFGGEHGISYAEQIDDAVDGGDWSEIERVKDRARFSFNWGFAVLVFVVILVGIFYFGSGEDLTTPLSETESEAPVTDESEQDEASDEAAVFTGTIVSDNSWFTITVLPDGSASGTLNVFMEVDGGTVTQTGSFNGSLDEGNVVTCTGTFTGVSIDPEGNEFPHNGSVSIFAEPTSDDLSAWDVTAIGDPGDTVTVPAHAY